MPDSRPRCFGRHEARREAREPDLRRPALRAGARNEPGGRAFGRARPPLQWKFFDFFAWTGVAPPPPAGRRPAFLLESRASIGGGGVGAMGEWASIRGLRGRIGESVALRGWVAGKRSSGKIAFLQVRDGSGDRAGGGVAVGRLRGRLGGARAGDAGVDRLRSPASCSEDKRSPSGVEIRLSDFRVDSPHRTTSRSPPRSTAPRS